MGSDPVNQAWQDEALSQFSMLEYLEDRHGLARREEYEQRELESALRVTVPRGVTPVSYTHLDVYKRQALL